jgi:hypothetical protein
MLDKNYNVIREISIFSNDTELLVDKIDLADFNLAEFQKEFGEDDPTFPMFAEYEVKEKNLKFLIHYLEQPLEWDFEKYSYFISAHSV